MLKVGHDKSDVILVPQTRLHGHHIVTSTAGGLSEMLAPYTVLVVQSNLDYLNSSAWQNTGSKYRI